MKALILSGGKGTRIRPFSFSVPKPMIEFMNKPIICHQIDALMNAGVTHVILALSKGSEDFQSQILTLYEKKSIEIIFSIEPQPLGKSFQSFYLLIKTLPN